MWLCAARRRDRLVPCSHHQDAGQQGRPDTAGDPPAVLGVIGIRSSTARSYWRMRRTRISSKRRLRSRRRRSVNSRCWIRRSAPGWGGHLPCRIRYLQDWPSRPAPYPWRQSRHSDTRRVSTRERTDRADGKRSVTVVLATDCRYPRACRLRPCRRVGNTTNANRIIAGTHFLHCSVDGGRAAEASANGGLKGRRLIGGAPWRPIWPGVLRGDVFRNPSMIRRMIRVPVRVVAWRPDRVNAEQRVENVACLEIVLDRACLYRRTKKLVEAAAVTRVVPLRKESGV